MAAPINGKRKDKATTDSVQQRQAGHKWSDLFKSTSKPCSSFKLQKWKESERDITKDELRNLGYCLVGFILGRFPGIQAIDQVRKSWQVESNISIHDSGWLIFSFRNEQDRDSVLERGPYETLGSAWVLKKMPHYFRFDDECFTLIPTWIRLHGLPLDFWSVNALGKIASSIGDPIAADECTALMTKTSFARILVEVDVTKPLIREVRFTMPNGSVCTQKVVYEREPRWCSQCRMIGHLDVDCRRKPGRNPDTSSLLKQTEKRTGSGEPQPPVSPAVMITPTTAQNNGHSTHVLPSVQETPCAAHVEFVAGECSRPQANLDNERTIMATTDSPGGSNVRHMNQLASASDFSPSTLGNLQPPCTMEVDSKEGHELEVEEVVISPTHLPCSIRDVPAPNECQDTSSPSSQKIHTEELSLPPMNAKTRRQKSKGKGKVR